MARPNTVPSDAEEFGIDSDSYYVDPTLDTKETRMFFVCKKCPMHEHCSQRAWDRVCARSQDIDKLKALIKEHLMTSSHHFCPSDAADALVNSEMEWDVIEETYDDREKYRKKLEDRQKADLAERQKEDTAREANKGKGKNKDKGKGKGKEKGPYARPARPRSPPPRTAFTDTCVEGQQTAQMKGLHKKIDALTVATQAATAAATAAAKSATAMRRSASSSSVSTLAPAVVDTGCNAGMNDGTVLNMKCASVHGMTYQLFQFVPTSEFIVDVALNLNDLYL